MAIQPAPMDQCEAKCRCLSGINQDQAYSCKDPCASGETFIEEVCDCSPAFDENVPCLDGNIVVESHLNLKGRPGVSTTTFYPDGMAGAVPGALLRDEGGQIQALGENGWFDVGAAPFAPGDTYSVDGIEYQVDIAINTPTAASSCCEARQDIYWKTTQGDPGSFTHERGGNSVAGPWGKKPPFKVSGPHSQGDAPFATVPHSYAYFTSGTYGCNGEVIEYVGLYRTALGDPPYHPEGSDWHIESENDFCDCDEQQPWPPDTP